jgi:hypothetical protein
MGLFDFGKKDVKLGGSIADQIQLRAKTFDAVLKTKTLPVAMARVVFVIDVSGSMQGEFNNGTVQDTVERLMPLALRFDDNGEMEIYRFSGTCNSCKNVGMGNIKDFVNQNIAKGAQWNGTEYAPIFEAIYSDYVEKNTSILPTFVVVVTDGDCSDKHLAEQAIKQISQFNIFFKFIGIGGAGFSFLEKLDTLSGRKVDNANFFPIDNINRLGDEDLYKGLLEEYDIWQKAAKQAGIL